MTLMVSKLLWGPSLPSMKTMAVNSLRAITVWLTIQSPIMVVQLWKPQVCKVHNKVLIWNEVNSKHLLFVNFSSLPHHVWVNGLSHQVCFDQLFLWSWWFFMVGNQQCIQWCWIPSHHIHCDRYNLPLWHILNYPEYLGLHCKFDQQRLLAIRLQCNLHAGYL